LELRAARVDFFLGELFPKLDATAKDAVCLCPSELIQVCTGVRLTYVCCKGTAVLHCLIPIEGEAKVIIPLIISRQGFIIG
jgi:hypothetical protein